KQTEGPGRKGRALGGSFLRSRLAGDRDLAVDDVLLGGLDLVGDVVDLATGGGQAHAVRLQVVDDVGAALGTALERLDELEDADVDALEHRGHDDLLELG